MCHRCVFISINPMKWTYRCKATIVFKWSAAKTTTQNISENIVDDYISYADRQIVCWIVYIWNDSNVTWSTEFPIWKSTTELGFINSFALINFTINMINVLATKYGFQSSLFFLRYKSSICLFSTQKLFVYVPFHHLSDRIVRWPLGLIFAIIL